MSGLSVGPRCGEAPNGLAFISPASGLAIGLGNPRPWVFKQGQAMRQRHPEPIWRRTTVPHPVFRCVSSLTRALPVRRTSSRINDCRCLASIRAPSSASDGDDIRTTPHLRGATAVFLLRSRSVINR